MIHRATFKNFKALRDVSLRLSPLTLIVGPNASGKTSILQGIHYLTRLAANPPEEALIDGCTIAEFGTKDAAGDWIQSEMVLGLAGVWDCIEGSLQLTVGASLSRQGPYDLNVVWDGQAVSIDRERTKIDREISYRYKDLHPILSAIAPSALLYLDPKAIARPSYSEEVTLRLHVDGSNLASVLADLAVSDPGAYQGVREATCAVVPSLTKLRLNRATIVGTEYRLVEDEKRALYEKVTTKAVGYRIVLDFVNCGDLAADRASEGTLMTLGLLTILSVPSRPRLVLIDEFERGLHPKALGELVRQIRELQKRFPDLQVIGTTHSPYLVDHFEASEVILTTLLDDGSVAAGTLDEHPDFECWKDEMKPGEFWSTVGEDWLRDRKEPGGE